jgi:hypothetical protein
MDFWKIELKVEECTGIVIYPNVEYTLLLRLGINCSTQVIPSPLLPSRPTSYPIDFAFRPV